VGGLIEEAGLSKDRLMLFHLPGSAGEDMALGVGVSGPVAFGLADKVAAVREAFVERLGELSRNPLGMGELPDESPYDVDSQDESD
jgi:hypothetical protein